MLQKAMKQGRNVHGIPLLDAYSDHNNNIKDVWPRWGHAYSVSLSVQLKQLPHCFYLNVHGADYWLGLTN